MLLELLAYVYIFTFSFGVAFVVWGFLHFLQGKYICRKWKEERNGYRQMIFGFLLYVVATLVK